MSDFHKNTQNIEDALERMTSMEPYHCNPFNNPPQLKKKAGYLLKELATLTEQDGDRRAEILKELFGTYHHLAFPGDGFHCDYAGYLTNKHWCRGIYWTRCMSGVFWTRYSSISKKSRTYKRTDYFRRECMAWCECNSSRWCDHRSWQCDRCR